MALPLIIGLLRIGKTVYKVATNKAAQKLAREAIDDFGAFVIKNTTKKNIKPLTSQVLKDKTPTTLERVVTAGRVKKLSPGRKSSKEGITVGSTRKTAASRSDKTIGAVIGGITVGATAAAAYAGLTAANKKKVQDALKKGMKDGQIETLLKQAIKEEKKEKASKNKPLPRPKKLLSSGAVTSSKPPPSRPKGIKK